MHHEADACDNRCEDRLVHGFPIHRYSRIAIVLRPDRTSRVSCALAASASATSPATSQKANGCWRGHARQARDLGIEQRPPADDAMQPREHDAPADPLARHHGDQAAAFADLLEQRRRHRVDRPGQQDHVERRLAGMAGGRIVADRDHDVVGAELVEQRLSLAPRPRRAPSGSRSPPVSPAPRRRSRWRSRARARHPADRPARPGSGAPAPEAR